MNVSAADLYHLHPFASICTVWRSQVDLRLKWKNPKNLLRPYFIQFALLFIPETSGDNSSDIFEMFTVCGFIFLSLAGLGKQFLGTQRPEPERESELGRWRQVILTCTWVLWSWTNEQILKILEGAHSVDLPWFTVICHGLCCSLSDKSHFCWMYISNTSVGWFGQETDYDKLICLTSTLLSWTVYNLRLHAYCMKAAWVLHECCIIVFVINYCSFSK